MSKKPTQSPLPRSNYAAIGVQVEQVANERIQSAARPQKHRKQHIAKLAAGISRYGFLVNLGKVPVIRIDHLTSEQLRMLAMFENKIAQASEFDEEALNLEFEELRLAEPELELTDSGFAIGEIDALAGRIKTAALDDLNYVDDELLTRPAVTRLGDEWQCGRHRVICGNSTDHEVIAKLAGGATFRQLIADAPYNLPTRAFSSSGRLATSRWPPGRWTGQSSSPFSPGFLRPRHRIWSMERCSTPSWMQSISASFWRPPRRLAWTIGSFWSG